MAKQTINIGTSANKGDGDPIRTAFDKVNDNFDELYSDVAALTGTGNSTVDLQANVFADDSTLLVDAINGAIPAANITGSLSGVAVSTADITPCQLFGKLLEDKLYAHHAIQDSLIVSDVEIRANVDSQLQAFLQNSGGTMEELLKFYKKGEWNKDNIKKYFKNDNSFDVINSQFAIHYLFDTQSSINYLIDKGLLVHYSQGHF